LGLALRALQQMDEVSIITTKDDARPGVNGRRLLTDALTALGHAMGLTCTGTLDDEGYYDHSSETCPIHEWLVGDDYYAFQT
jgi:hypothetical protein